MDSDQSTQTELAQLRITTGVVLAGVLRDGFSGTISFEVVVSDGQIKDIRHTVQEEPAKPCGHDPDDYCTNIRTLDGGCAICAHDVWAKTLKAKPGRGYVPPPAGSRLTYTFSDGQPVEIKPRTKL